MTKRIVSFCLIAFLLFSFSDCVCPADCLGLTDTTPEAVASIQKHIEENDSYYVVSTDWMTISFAQNDYRKEDLPQIVREADQVMADIRKYLNLSYGAEEAANTICVFDSSYRNESGLERSQCFPREKTMFCISLENLVHEYVHMVSENNNDMVYSPDKILCEGLAEYVSFHFYDDIASEQFSFFTPPAVPENTDASEHQTVCDLLSENGLAYDAPNYTKAFVALVSKNYELSDIDRTSDYYNYFVGYVLAEYCISQLGGIERFILMYCDSIAAVEVYGKPLEGLVSEACANNTMLFYH
jgi:hypothetical protein